MVVGEVDRAYASGRQALTLRGISKKKMSEVHILKKQDIAEKPRQCVGRQEQQKQKKKTKTLGAWSSADETLRDSCQLCSLGYS